MKIAVTGATGFLGKYLVNHLNDLSYKLLVIARPEEEAQKLFNNIHLFESDYSTVSLVEALKGVDIVLHLAAQTLERDSDPLRVSKFLQVNVNMTENILVAANESGVSTVYQMSSNNVYSSTNNIPFIESENPITSTVYGLSKIYAEKLGEFFSYKTRLSVISLRLARLFGYGERESVVFTKYMKLAMQKKTLEVWGQGSTKIEYLYVKDCVSAIESALKKNVESGIYNLGSSEAYSVLQIAKTVNKVFKNEGNLITDQTKPETGHDILMDSSKFNKKTNWKPNWVLDNAINEMYNYYLNEK